MSIIEHLLTECSKVEFRCSLCLKQFKRDKYRKHDCERLSPEDREQKMRELRLAKLDNSGGNEDRSGAFNKNQSLLD